MRSVRKTGCWTVFAFVIAIIALIYLFTPFRQGKTASSSRQIRANIAILGGDVQIEQDEYVSGNLLVVGDDLTLEGRIGGNLVVIGGDATLTGHAQVGGDVSVVGGDADVEGSSEIGGNVAVIGGDVDLAGHARVGGNVRVVGGRIEQDPDVHVAGGISWRIYTNSVAQPNLSSAAPAPLAFTDPPKQPDPPVPPVVDAGGLGERARASSRRHQSAVAELAELAEDLAEAAEEAAEDAAEAAEDAAEDLAEAAEDAAEAAEDAAEELAEAAEDAAEAAAEAAEEAAEAAREQAELQHETALEAAAAARARAASTRTPWFLVFLGKLVQAFLWTLLITGLVLLFGWLLPKQVRAVSKTAEKEAALSFATGAIAVMGTAILVAILTITICFALLALPILALLALVILCGWTVTCYFLGRRLDELLAGQDRLPWNPLVSVGLSSLVITGVTTFAWAIFPCLGFFVALLIGSTGTGAVIVHVARRSGRLSNGVPTGGSDAPEPQGEFTATGSAEVSDAAADAPVEDSPGPVGSPAEKEKTPDEDATVSEEGPGPPTTPAQEDTDSLPADAASQDPPDDLTRIVGIGSVFSERLQEAGITTFSQLAALDAQQLAQTLGCPASRVQRERLREQAQELAGQL